jgi:hypothetical protein
VKGIESSAIAIVDQYCIELCRIRQSAKEKVSPHDKVLFNFAESSNSLYADIPRRGNEGDEKVSVSLLSLVRKRDEARCNRY